MNTRTSTIAVALTAILLAGAALANTPAPTLADLQPPVVQFTTNGSAICGHVGELLAARSALAVGNRAGALVHLKEARRLLSTCEDRLSIEEGDTHERSM